ncbi:MAG: type II toxin-antitoxin system PemK/MazF family toxin [Planctomycetes bacterium]|nr:type II toxin-antitoxin system PemK/MazF family toxin [Planctomycetota bacterium]
MPQSKLLPSCGITSRTRSGVSTYRQRDIALVPFPFSDLSASKVRPVFILSNDEHNQQSADVVVCGLTTNLEPSPYSVPVAPADVEQAGTLRHKSKIKADAISFLDQSLIIKPIARLKLSVFRQVVREIERLIEPP